MNWTATQLVVFSFAAAVSAQTSSRRTDSTRECATCHLEWFESFRDPQAILLIEAPRKPAVALEETCLGCHDGSVGDSRRRVWLEHGHRIGTMPPDTMTVPESLPLVDGAIDCRTCHTAHGGGEETPATTVFTRVPNERSELCMMCHTPDHGNDQHPLKIFDVALPDQAKLEWAHYGPDNNEVICQSCHTPHGAAGASLLVEAPGSDILCVSCHTVLTPNIWQDGPARKHPRDAPLGAVQKQAVEAWSAHAGLGETLACLSCHRMHDSPAKVNLLNETLSGSAICLACHPDQGRLLETKHDLRSSAASELNMRGLTATQSGPCGACHSVHHDSRKMTPTVHDPASQCVTCHRVGECAEDAGGLDYKHPSHIGNVHPTLENMRLFDSPGDDNSASTTCLTCHDPHTTAHAKFLRATPDEICASCHKAQADSLVGGHDFVGNKKLRNASGRTAAETGKCGFCHGIHQGSGPAIWAATTTPPTTPDDYCLVCHQNNGMAKNQIADTLHHPTGTARTTISSDTVSPLPLFANTCQRDANGSMSCASCHDPHANATVSPALLRIEPGESSTSLCITCHPEAGAIQSSLHGEAAMRAFHGNKAIAQTPSTCGPCHAVHAKNSVDGMWAGPMDRGAKLEASNRCLGCHGPSGTATRVPPLAHPAVSMRNVNPAGSRGWMPLARNGTSPTRQIDCMTCHIPHGQHLEDKLSNNAPTSLVELGSRKSLLRPYVAPNLCSSCHGFEGIYRFLNFHHAQTAKNLP
ncbi:MAG: hypothetical protein GXP29_14415 [Planctomycetes bacterium]|nr:hypothetical protein [Planctomycetota bacterium]